MGAHRVLVRANWLFNALESLGCTQIAVVGNAAQAKHETTSTHYRWGSLDPIQGTPSKSVQDTFIAHGEPTVYTRCNHGVHTVCTTVLKQDTLPLSNPVRQATPTPQYMGRGAVGLAGTSARNSLHRSVVLILGRTFLEQSRHWLPHSGLAGAGFVPWPGAYIYHQASLSLELGYAPQVGDSFLVLDQTASNSVSGSFLGQPPNSIYDTTNGYSFGLAYGSEGVRVITLRRPDSHFVLWKGSGYAAQGILLPASSYWSSSNNWAGGAGPLSGSRVEVTPYQLTYYNGSSFGRIAVATPPMTNDLPEGTALASLLFSGTNNELYGNALQINEGLTNQASSGTNACHLDLISVGGMALEVDTGGTLLLDHSFDGSGTLTKTGAGTLIYSGTTFNAFVGSVAVNSGTLQLDGFFTDGSFAVNGGQLSGTGTVSSVTVNTGTLSPGDGPGVLHIQGDLAMGAGGALQVELNGPVAGSSYDQVQVNGAVNLANATLSLQPGYSIAPGTAFLILVNDGTDPITGTFAGLPEGAVFAAGGQYFRISYKAGSGANDVVVTRLNPPANFTGLELLDPDTLQLQGQGGANVNYSIQANTNLATTNWVNLGSAPANGAGVLSFNVTNVPGYPQRFFRIQGP